MKCGLSLNSLNVFAPFLEKYAQRVPDASHLRQLIPIIQAQELERVKKKHFKEGAFPSYLMEQPEFARPLQ